MRQFYRLILLVLFGLVQLRAHAQDRPHTISGSFQQLNLLQFVQELEQRTPYRFYFDSATADSVVVNVQATNQELPAVLHAALDAQGLRFAIDQRRVFITRSTSIQTELPPDYFQPARAAARVRAAVAAEIPVTPASAAPSSRVAESKLYTIGLGRSAKSTATIIGKVRDSQTGEPMVGVAVFTEVAGVGTATDAFGSYSLTLPIGRHEIRLRGLGIKNTYRRVQLNADGRLDIETEEDITPLKEVVIEAEKDKNVTGMQMGLEKLDIRTIRQVPTAFGETDILRVVLTLPGVKSVGESSTGLSVRGGGTDQNLILFNNAVIYNPAHLFGFFSAFNPDVVKSVELYKSAVPAKYGGRLSSVLNITTREGNKKEFTGSGGIGVLTSRLTLEGPLIKDKTSFVLGGRTTYSDWILHQLPSKSYRNSSASFYDLNLHLSHDFNEKNSLYLTGYTSKDKFQLAGDTAYAYQNTAASLQWKHVVSNKLYGVLTGTYSHYRYHVASEQELTSGSELSYGIRQTGAQLDFSYYPNPKHTIEFGVSSLLYHVSPGALQPLGAESLLLPDVLAREQAVESAAYLSDKIDLTQRISVDLGLRYSLFSALGPHDVYRYADDNARTETTIVDTLSVGHGKSLATYHGPEYRAAVRYALTDRSSVKASYNRTRQYIHMLSNTASMSPTDVWKLSDYHIRPQVGDQYALGYYQNFKNNTIETSVEVYYKDMRDFVDYKSGATLILNHHIETDIVNAQGKAYGVELMVKKLTGKINGWVSYTYARSLVRINAATTANMINGGNYYPSNYDKPHDFSLISNYRFSRRFSTSFNFTYSTGRPITLPLSKYYADGAVRVYYSERNAYRVPDYYRADLALNLEGNHKVKKLAHSSWTLGIYNLTGRKNPYSVYFRATNGLIKGYKLSIFGQPIPTLTYNFKF